MGGDGKLSTRRGMGSSAAGRIQHTQDISWQARQKTPGLVRPQRPGATDSYEQKRLSPPENVANQEHYIHHCSIQRYLQTATKTHQCTGVRLVWERKVVELQRAADRNNMKGFYNGLKEVWGPMKKRPIHLKSTDGMETFSDSKRVVARWSEHFQTLLNVPGDIDNGALDNIP
ncbi:hypothetical protein NP493_126g00030 [Ridgeia piscesae]|uniref:Uncharacterized protein n=1 Tax=Ridgeia piscesae TaxID=27915 RepID=A0AAD9P5R2_RIDPI|nr:hypothetical protein NP493_126g00030 [Ridgeia piscesae]